MFHPGLRNVLNKFSRPPPGPIKPKWETYFTPRRTFLNASRDAHWPRKPWYEGAREFNWDAFRWTNFRVIGPPPPSTQCLPCGRG